MGKNREVCRRRLRGVRIGNRCISHGGNHVLTNRIEGNYGIHHGQKRATRCPHSKEGIGMKEGVVQWFCIVQFFQVCVVGKQNDQKILRLNLSEQAVPALRYIARLRKLWMVTFRHANWRIVFNIHSYRWVSIWKKSFLTCKFTGARSAWFGRSSKSGSRGA